MAPRDARPLPNIELLRAALAYDPETGVIRWKHRSDRDNSWNAHFAGKAAGCFSDEKRTYMQIRFNGRGYRYHRIAWALHYGEEPPPMLDHRDCDPTNNRIGNLRAATWSQNNSNRKSRSNTKRLRGVVYDLRANKFNSYIRIAGGKKKNLGKLFDGRRSACRILSGGD